MGGFTSTDLRIALTAIADAMERQRDELNATDARLGDGDLGVTMVRGTRAIVEELDRIPADLGQAFIRCASALTRTSGSSFGTLLATGLMSFARSCKGRTEVPWGELSGLLGGALQAIASRGKSSLGEKTVLDAIEAARAATLGLEDPGALARAADEAIGRCLEEFRDRPAQQGRARMFGERSRGLDDPGMLALKRIAEALAG